jgi:hypothetical protein
MMELQNGETSWWKQNKGGMDLPVVVFFKFGKM